MSHTEPPIPSLAAALVEGAPEVPADPIAGDPARSAPASDSSSEAVGNEATTEAARASAAAEEPREFALHAAHARLWLWQSILTAAVIGVPSLIALSVLFGWKGALLALAQSLLIARLMIAYGRAYARLFRCALLDDGLLIEQGVFWRRQTFVPRARVQHTDVDQGPLERLLEMATLKVFTAGTHEVKLEVEGIGRDSALRLRDALLARHGHDGV